MQDETQAKSKGIYLIPNLLTTGTLFFGFYALIAAAQGNFVIAAVAIYIAMVTDTLDGRFARLTGTQTAFGSQYDSLADMVAFAVAPAFMAYEWALASWGKLGWSIAFIYVAATALRLARFNVQPEDDKASHFIGLPCPSAAAVIAGFIWNAENFAFQEATAQLMMMALTLLCAGLMVGQVAYPSFKRLELTSKVSSLLALGVVLLFVLVALDPPIVLFAIFFGFMLYGPVRQYGPLCLKCNPLAWFKRRGQQ